MKLNFVGKFNKKQWKTVTHALFYTHWHSKAVALILAVAAWCYMHMVAIEVAKTEATLKMTELPSGWNAFLTPSRVTLTLQGPSELLASLTAQPLVGIVSASRLLQDYKAPHKKVTIPVRDFFHLSQGIKIFGKPLPEVVDVELVIYESKVLTVKPVLQLESTEGYEINDISVTPTLMLVKIPHLLRQEIFLPSETIQLGRIIKPGKYEVAARLVNTMQGWPILYAASTNEVVVSFYVQERISLWLSFRVRAICYLEQGLPPLQIATPTPLQVQVRGSKEVIEKYSEIVGYVILPEKMENSQILPLQFMIPDDVKIIGSAPIPLPSHLTIEKKK